jgi:hypothetical protein
VAQWIEKTNRYSSCIDRARVEHTGFDLIGFAHARIDHLIGRTRDAAPGGYPAAAALLRATYDLIDRLKVWEEERGLDGAALFRQVCADLDAAYGGTAPARAGVRRTLTPAVEAGSSTEAILCARLRQLRAQHDAAVGAMAIRESAMAIRESKLAKELLATLVEARAIANELLATCAALRAIEHSASWRATGWARRVVGRLRAGR